MVSPGVPAELPALELGARARHSGVERDRTGLAISAREAGGITGSNGKTTTTSLVAHILEDRGDSDAGGRKYRHAADFARGIDPSDATVTVAEVSSFQLETIEAFRPDIGVLLNLTPDHLDRHASFEEYARAKMRMFENQLERDAAMLNADDPEVTRRMPSRPHVFWFSRQKRVAEGAFLRDDEIIFRRERLGDAARAARSKFRCAANTTSKTFWPHAPPRILRAPSRRRSRGRENVSRRRAPARIRRPKSAAWNITTIRKPPTWTPR